MSKIDLLSLFCKLKEEYNMDAWINTALLVLYEVKTICMHLTYMYINCSFYDEL